MLIRSIFICIVFFILFSCDSKKGNDNSNNYTDEILFNVKVEDCDISSYKFQIPDEATEIKGIKEYKSSKLFGSHHFLEDEYDKKVIINQLLTAIPKLSKHNVEENEFYKKPFIYIRFGSFSDKSRNENGEKTGIWQDILFNPFSNNLLLYINDDLYKSGIWTEASSELVNAVIKNYSNSKIIYKNSDYLISFIKDERIETCYLILIPKNGNCRLLGDFKNAYFSTNCRKINLIKNRIHVEINESSGKGTAVNSHTMYILEINSVDSKSKIVFEKEISGFHGPSPDDYWENKIEYNDINQDSNSEIILTNKGNRSIFKYDKDKFKEIKE